MSKSIIFMASLTAASLHAAVPTRFTVTDLGLANSLGGSQSGALAVNNSGQVAAYFESGAKITETSLFYGDIKAVGLGADNSLLALGPLALSGEETSSPLQNYARAINASGNLAGFGQQHMGDGVYQWQGFYSLNGEWLKLSEQWEAATKLPSAGQFHASSAQEHRLLGNNDANILVGSVLANDGDSSLYYVRPLWVDPTASPLVLRALKIPAANGQQLPYSGWAYDINNQQQIVGWVSFDDRYRQALVYDYRQSADHSAPQIKRLSNLSGEGSTELRAINDQGLSTGASSVEGGATHAVLVDVASLTSDSRLPAEADIHDASVAPNVVAKNQYSEGLAINSVGDVVGRFKVSSAPDRYHAFYYHKASDQFLDLNLLIDANADGSKNWTLNSATGITDPDGQGQIHIVGIGQHPLTADGTPVGRAFRLTTASGTPVPVTATPEPERVSAGGAGGSLLLLVAGWGLLSLRRRPALQGTAAK